MLDSLTGRPSAMGAWSGAGVERRGSAGGAEQRWVAYRLENLPKTRDTSAPLPGAGLPAEMSALPRISSALRPGADV